MKAKRKSELADVDPMSVPIISGLWRRVHLRWLVCLCWMHTTMHREVHFQRGLELAI